MKSVLVAAIGAKKYARKIVGLFCIGLVCNINAVPVSALEINFDELPWSTEPVSAYDQPIDDEYANKGIVFLDTYLTRDFNTLNQFAFGLGGIYMSFTNALPTRVSFDLFTESVDGIDIQIFGPDGINYENVFVSTDSFITVSNADGISSIGFINQQYRTVMGIDNISVEFASVPEPMSLGLLGLSLALLVAMRRGVFV